MSLENVFLPELGDFHDMPVIELSVQPGNLVVLDQTLLMVESEKATMDVPTPVAGRIVALKVSLGDKVNPGTLPAIVETQIQPESAALPATMPVLTNPVIVPVPVVLVPVEANAAPPASVSAGEHIDLLILGGGPGGYTAAFRAADLGRSVTLIDRWDKLGGVCLNVGCIPSKALLHAAKVIKDAQSFAPHGLTFATPALDLDQLRTWKNSVVDRLTGGLVDLARRRSVTVLHGVARLTGPHSVLLEGPGGPRTLHFKQAILAAGSEPLALPFLPKDDPRIVDSTGALALKDIPQRLLVIGGGVIGLEMATIYEALGSQVTVVELMDQIIPGADRDLVTPLAKHMAAQGVQFLLQTKVSKVEASPATLTATLASATGTTQQIFDRILVAVGRRANGHLLHADQAGLHIAPDGSIPVDRQMRTSVPHLFAIGDLAGAPMLAHKATHEAKVAAEAACGHNVSFDARVIPAVAYTDPEVAWVGLTELEAKRLGQPVEKAVFPWAASGRSLALGRDEGFTKLLFHPETHRLLGAGIVGTSAGDLIAEAALAIEMGSDDADLAFTIHPHPTLSESIGAAAEISTGTITDLLPRRRPVAHAAATPTPTTTLQERP